MQFEQTEAHQRERRQKQTGMDSSGMPFSVGADTFASGLLEYLGRLVDSRALDPKDDLISKLVVEQMKPGNIDKTDVVQNVFLLLVAGNATMVNMISLVSTNLQ